MLGMKRCNNIFWVTAPQAEVQLLIQQHK